MFRVARLVQQKSKQTGTTYMQRRFGHGAGPAENPIFKPEDKTMFSSNNFSQDPPNSIYGTMFQHPMNYQGHVPVTPTQFLARDLEQHTALYVRDPRVATTASLTGLQSIGITALALVGASNLFFDNFQFNNGIRPAGFQKKEGFQIVTDAIFMQPIPKNTE